MLLIDRLFNFVGLTIYLLVAGHGDLVECVKIPVRVNPILKNAFVKMCIRLNYSEDAYNQLQMAAMLLFSTAIKRRLL